ncbi:hypothetical protein BH11BAC4_BH11BAC4_02150 [soil metagenome]
MKKSLLFLLIVVSIFSCKKDDPQPTAANNANTLTFDSTFHNVVMTGSVNGSKWQLNAVINLPAVGGFDRKLAFNLKLLQRPTTDASYNIVNTETDITAATAMLYINHVDYNPSPADNISNSYFLTSGVSGSIQVSIVSGKVSLQFSGLTLSGNRGGADKTNVAANLTEN